MLGQGRFHKWRNIWGFWKIRNRQDVHTFMPGFKGSIRRQAEYVSSNQTMKKAFHVLHTINFKLYMQWKFSKRYKSGGYNDEVELCYDVELWLIEKNAFKRGSSWTPCRRIIFTENFQGKQIPKDRKMTRGCQGLRMGVRMNSIYAQRIFLKWYKYAKTELWRWLHNSVHVLKTVAVNNFFIVDTITDVSLSTPFAYLHAAPGPPSLGLSPHCYLCAWVMVFG